jgi:hypothetical protein
MGEGDAEAKVENRLERLDDRVTEIEQLPARMDRLESQMVQLRTEMRDEFSAVRGEIRTGDVMIVTTLTEQTEESRRQTRVLFEEAVSRIASLQGQPGSPRSKKKR